MTTSFSTQITDKDDQGRTILTRESPSGNWLCGLFEQQFKVEVKVVVRMVLNEETAKFHEQGELPWLHSVLRCELLQFFPKKSKRKQRAEDKQVKFARVGSAATSGGGQNTAPGPAAGTRVQPGAASSNFASKANTDERIGDFVFFERCSGFAVSERVRVHRAHTPLMEVGGKIGTIKKITKRKDFHVYFMVEMEDASMRVNKVRSKIPGKEPHWLVCCIGGIEKLV